MPRRIQSRKFVSPAFKGEKFNSKDAESNDNKSELDETKLKARETHSLSDSQYDDLFSTVLKEPTTPKNGKPISSVHDQEDDEKEHHVVVPEPNDALSPAEGAEEPREESTTSEGSTVTTPDQRIDNSILPPIKRKKPGSKKFSLSKMKPTKLNFDDCIMGKPDNPTNPVTSKILHPKTTHKPKKSMWSNKSGDPVRSPKPVPSLKSSPTKRKSFKSKNKNEDCRNRSISKHKSLSPHLQSHPSPGVAEGTHANLMKTPHQKLLPSSQQSYKNIGGGTSLSQTPKSSQLLSSQTSSISSQMLSPRTKLYRLQRKRYVGLWVQCSNKDCSKWRYLSTTRDPTEVPDNWQCYMNNDTARASCSAPEKGPTPVEEEDLIHNIYTAGSLVWGRLAGYPWWPAIVDDDPDVEQYYWITETCDIPTHYNVAFFDEKPVTRAWLTPGAMMKYSDPNSMREVLKTAVHGVNFNRRIEVARQQADEAMMLPIDERLKKFSFIARYKGPIGKKRYPSDSEDEIDTKTKGKSKKGGKVSKKTKTASEEDPLFDYSQSLEVVKEVNEVLNELTESSDSDGSCAPHKGGKVAKKTKRASEEDLSFDYSQSLEVVKEVNEVLNELDNSSDSDAEPSSSKISARPKHVKKKKKEKASKDAAKVENKEKKKGGKKETKSSDKPNPKAKNKVKDETRKKVNEGEQKKSSKKKKTLDVNKTEGTVKGAGEPTSKEVEHTARKVVGDPTSSSRKKTEKKKNKSNDKKSGNVEKEIKHAEEPIHEEDSDPKEKVVPVKECTEGSRGDDLKTANSHSEDESSDEENAPGEVDSDAETVVGSDEESNSVKGKDNDEEEMAKSSSSESSSEDDGQDSDSANPPFSPISNIPESRDSDDMFEPQSCTAEGASVNSQVSADFEVEE